MTQQTKFAKQSQDLHKLERQFDDLKNMNEEKQKGLDMATMKMNEMER